MTTVPTNPSTPAGDPTAGSSSDSPAAAVEPTLPPATRRGQATRQALVDGARRVFERDGFVDARIIDIAKESGVATGSFYTYFPDKDAVLAAVFGELQEEMLHPQLSSGGRHPLVSGVIAASHRGYLETYRANAKLMALREQVAAVDGAFRETRRERSREFVSRNARMITRLQAAGLADPDLDPELSALSLSGMVARAAYSAFVLRDDVPMDHLVETLTRLWMNALRVPEDAPALDGSAAHGPAPTGEAAPAGDAPEPRGDATGLPVESEIDLDEASRDDAAERLLGTASGDDSAGDDGDASPAAVDPDSAAEAAAKKAAKKAKAEKKRAKAEKKAKKLARAKATTEESDDVRG